jgi:hypothetical protein
MGLTFFFNILPLARFRAFCDRLGPYTLVVAHVKMKLSMAIGLTYSNAQAYNLYVALSSEPTPT